jgi:hypothetical protein
MFLSPTIIPSTALSPLATRTAIEESLEQAAEGLFNDLAHSGSSVQLLSHFSRTEVVSLSIAPSLTQAPIHLLGLNAVRSYFDLIATNWTHSQMRLHSRFVDPEARQVVIVASVAWTWKESGRSWTEDFTCTLNFDEQFKVKGFSIQTNSGENTCLMFAVDS